ncbi:MAG: tRNA lysidine(34) synthetase TilS, partial [Steroidobacteraceae bacterium]
LGLERAELEGWARERGLAWVEDPTNVDERLDRNYLRRRIVPLLRARWPAAGRTVSRSAMHVAEAQRLLDLLAGADAERAAVGDALSVRRLRALTPERRRNALRFWIARRGGPLPDGKRLAEIAGPVIDARPDAHPEVAWGDRVVRREGDRLGLAKRGRGDPGRARPDPSACLARPEIVPDIHGPIDLDAVRGPLTVALRRGGERLRLRRGGPSRALKTLLQEARIPSTERASMPLLWCGERLLAAGDLWVDASIRAGEDTVRRARLVWHTASYIC